MPFENDASAGPDTARPVDASAIREEIWLLGQPSLSDYLDYVKRAVDGGADMDRRALVDGWR